MNPFVGCFADKRLAARAHVLLEALTKHQTVTLSKISKDWAEQMSFYRFLHNDRVSLTRLIEGVGHSLSERIEGRHYLVLADTTQLNYERQTGVVEGLGLIGDNRSRGFFLHPSLVVDAADGICVGVSDVQTWVRSVDKKDKVARGYKRLPIEEKESYRWIKSLEQSHLALAKASAMTFIADREGDMYELFAKHEPGVVDVLLRSRDNRRIEGGKLFEYLSAQSLLGTYRFNLRGDLRKSRQGREVELEVRCGPVSILEPATKGVAGNQVAMYAIEARETNPPGGEKPILWRLLTSHVVESIAQARQCIYWYSQRWYIEQLFRLLKQKGFEVESSQIESGESLMKLVVFALVSALDVMRLLLTRHPDENQPIGHLFTAQQQQFLKELGPTLEGKTEKQSNPHPGGTLRWAAWIIARLGSWKGYTSQGRAGPITYHDGLKRFHLLFEGWCMAKENVYNA